MRLHQREVGAGARSAISSRATRTVSFKGGPGRRGRLRPDVSGDWQRVLAVARGRAHHVSEVRKSYGAACAVRQRVHPVHGTVAGKAARRDMLLGAENLRKLLCQPGRALDDARAIGWGAARGARAPHGYLLLERRLRVVKTQSDNLREMARNEAC